MPDALYKILGLKPDADDAAIRKAYRQLAKKYHPDVNKGDGKAAERFKKISQAYAILGNKEKKRKYDHGEIDETGAARAGPKSAYDYAGAGRGGAHGFGDIFDDLFGGRGGGAAHGFEVPGSDIHYRLKVDFLETTHGADKRVTMPDGKSLEIRIPAGLRDGQTLRLKGKGRPGVGGGRPGDALVSIAVRPHPDYRLKGNDIYYDLPVSLQEAVLGATIDVPAPGGRVSLKIPPGSNGGKLLRVAGRGMPVAKTGGVGDFYVRLKIMLPEKPDREFKDFISRWSGRNPYNPREKS